MADLIPLPPFPYLPIALGIPPVARALIDQQAPELLAQALSGSVPPVLTAMLNSDIPSMLNGLTGIPFSLLASALPAPPAASGTAAIDQAKKIATTKTAPKWGIFDKSGKAVIVPDSVVSFDFGGDFRVLDYPIEQGSFETYNKVRAPYEPKVTMRKGGSVADRTAFITTLETIRKSLDPYTVTTPEYSYVGVTITHVDYSRKAERGATVIDADIHLRQIITTATQKFTTTAAPQAQDAFNGGTVETTPPTPAQGSAATVGAH